MNELANSKCTVMWKNAVKAYPNGSFCHIAEPRNLSLINQTSLQFVTEYSVCTLSNQLLNFLECPL